MVSDGGVTAADPPAVTVPPAVTAQADVPAVQSWSPAAPPGPASGGSGRRKWVIAAVALVVVLGVAGGLVAWAPWVPPPVLRPTGLRAGQPTISSAALGWSRPATGPLPDRYLILRDGKVVASVRGTLTSYQDRGLAPATTYKYRVEAVRGGVRSPVSRTLVVTTATPPLSAARVQGQWAVAIKLVRGGAALTNKQLKLWNESWLASSSCAAGACPVRLSAQWNGHAFKATLAPAGAFYAGRTIANIFPCGSGSTSFPIHSTVRIQLKVTSAATQDQAWTATSLAGTITVDSPYTASGSYYCAANTVVATVSAVP